MIFKWVKECLFWNNYQQKNDTRPILLNKEKNMNDSTEWFSFWKFVKFIRKKFDRIKLENLDLVMISEYAYFLSKKRLIPSFMSSKVQRLSLNFLIYLNVLRTNKFQKILHSMSRLPSYYVVLAVGYWKALTHFSHNVAFDIETGHLICTAKSNDWFLYEMQHRAEMGWNIK